ncbi:GumC family protein [Enhygromyxa salina]|nr:tyrosine-protein kinase family protein [Enhygromyxa salina]
MLDDPRDLPSDAQHPEPARGDPRRPEGRTWPRSTHAPPYAEAEPAANWTATMGSVLEILTILRRRWLRVAVTCLIVVVTTVLAVSLLRPQYRAEATLLLQPSGAQVLDEVQGLGEQLDTNTYRHYYRTQHEIISSRAVAAEALARLGLADDPSFLDIADLTDPDEQAEAAAEIDPIERLRELVEIREVHDSRVVRIRVEYSDPELAAEIANTVAQAYLDHVGGERSDTGARAAGDLGQERERARQRLRVAEQALDAFKAEHEITTIALEDRQSVITQNIIELSLRTKAAQASAFEAKNLYEQAKKLHQRGVSAGAAALLRPSERNIFDHLLTERLAAEAAFNDVDLQYGPLHPEWRQAKQRLDLFERTTKDQAGGHLATFLARYEAAHATQQQLAAELERERLRALELTRLEPGFRELARDVADAEEIYSVLSRRDTEVELTNRIEDEPQVRILDPATTPREPVRPRVLLCAAASVVVGLLLGCVLAVSVDLRDHTVRDLRDAERAVAGWDIAVLGQLPKLGPDPAIGPANLRAQRLRRDLQTHLLPQSLMAERARKVRAAIGFGLGKVRCPVLLVTSPASSEGKSSTALNLALSWCQAGKRVVLIDADMRRPRLHEVFPAGVDAQNVGLASVLQGGCELEDAIEQGPDGAPELLAVLRCGPVPETPSELLDTHAFRRTLAKLRESFDLVIFDSPPVLPVVDALLVARQVDGVVLVARAGATSEHEVQQSLGLLRQRDTNLLGLVLNDVDLRREGGRYGSAYYRYEPTA